MKMVIISDHTLNYLLNESSSKEQSLIYEALLALVFLVSFSKLFFNLLFLCKMVILIVTSLV